LTGGDAPATIAIVTVQSDQGGSGVVVMRTKLVVPAPRAQSVPRPALVEELADVLETRMTLVCAPTGWGKTNLLAEWATASSYVRFAWVSLDPRDDEPLRFWRYVTAALASVSASLAGTAQRRLQSPAVSISDEILPVLVNDLTDVSSPLVLVLDDFHVITSQEIVEQLGYLLDRLPDEVHLVIATQSEPALRLGRLRAMGDLMELRGERLRFSDEETAALLNQVYALELSGAQLAVLQHQTEGWVAGLNLAALSLQRPGDRERVLAGLPADDRFLVEYLWNEVVMGQPPEVRRFLMRTAILERLTGSLCDAVAERSGSEGTLRELERANLFVVPLDGTRSWFRYHHLFRELLRRQLERASPDDIPDLHRRASTWYEEHGLMVEAIDHAIVAGDVNYAVDELERNWLEFYSAGNATNVLDWIDRLPADVVDARPVLLAAIAGIARTMGRLDKVEPLLQRAEAAIADADPSTGLVDRVAAAVTLVRSYLSLAYGDVPRAVGLGRPLTGIEWPRGSLGHTTTCFLVGLALFFEDPDEAEPLLRDYLSVVTPGEEDVRRYVVLAQLAETHALRGEVEACERLAGEALAIARLRQLEEFPYTGQVHVALGAVLLAHGELDGAEEQFDRASTLTQRGGGRTENAHALVWLARARARQRDVAGARAALDAAFELVPDLGQTSMQRLFAELERELAVTHPRPAQGQAGEPLSDAELRVLRLLPGDLTYREIANHLYVSVNTVRTHAQRVRRKLGASTRAGVVARARELQLL
jgi:LuxR family transcriptional regulator, maltose regulon positive regulatory protein